MYLDRYRYLYLGFPIVDVQEGGVELHAHVCKYLPTVPNHCLGTTTGTSHHTASILPSHAYTYHSLPAVCTKTYPSHGFTRFTLTEPVILEFVELSSRVTSSLIVDMLPKAIVNNLLQVSSARAAPPRSFGNHRDKRLRAFPQRSMPTSHHQPLLRSLSVVGILYYR